MGFCGPEGFCGPGGPSGPSGPAGDNTDAVTYNITSMGGTISIITVDDALGNIEFQIDVVNGS